MASISYGVIALVFVIVGFLLRRVILVIERYRFARANGCKPPKRFPQSERFIGYQHFKQQLAFSKAKMVLPAGLKRFREVGNTFSVVALGLEVIATTEPENIKAILATSFKDFGLGGRLDAIGALLGQGIFTSDGLHWEHSRVVSTYPSK